MGEEDRGMSAAVVAAAFLFVLFSVIIMFSGHFVGTYSFVHNLLHSEPFIILGLVVLYTEMILF